MNSPSQQRWIPDFGLRTSDFALRTSDFGLRPSFGLQLRVLLSGLVVALVFQPHSLWACAACAGQSDSAMAKGMNWGILSLLAVIGVVLGGVVSFFVYLGKRSAALAAEPAKPNPAPLLESTRPVL